MIERDRLLIVDDQQMMRDLLTKLSDQLGFKNVDVAESGLAALKSLKSQPYSLVLSDLNMKPMDGIDLLRVVRADATLSHIKFIMVTVNPEFRMAMDAKFSGADMYLLKPFSMRQLSEAVDHVMGRA